MNQHNKSTESDLPGENNLDLLLWREDVDTSLSYLFSRSSVIAVKKKKYLYKALKFSTRILLKINNTITKESKSITLKKQNFVVITFRNKLQDSGVWKQASNLLHIHCKWKHCIHIKCADQFYSSKHNVHLILHALFNLLVTQ